MTLKKEDSGFTSMRFTKKQNLEDTWGRGDTMKSDLAGNE
jgi:hypothetical protein